MGRGAEEEGGVEEEGGAEEERGVDEKRGEDSSPPSSRSLGGWGGGGDIGWRIP